MRRQVKGQITGLRLASDRMTRETGNEQVECLERWIVLEPSMKRSFNKVDESDETGRRERVCGQ